MDGSKGARVFPRPGAQRGFRRSRSLGDDGRLCQFPHLQPPTLAIPASNASQGDHVPWRVGSHDFISPNPRIFIHQ